MFSDHVANNSKFYNTATNALIIYYITTSHAYFVYNYVNYICEWLLKSLLIMYLNSLIAVIWKSNRDRLLGHRYRQKNVPLCTSKLPIL